MFDRYLYDSTFNLDTDHKPLEIIFRNPQSKLPAFNSTVEALNRTITGFDTMSALTMVDLTKYIGQRMVVNHTHIAAFFPVEVTKFSQIVHTVPIKKILDSR